MNLSLSVELGTRGSVNPSSVHMARQTYRSGMRGSMKRRIRRQEGRIGEEEGGLEDGARHQPNAAPSIARWHHPRRIY